MVPKFVVGQVAKKYVAGETREDALQAGAHAFLTKPLRATDLYPWIEELHPEWSGGSFGIWRATEH